jgi:hypothetical protein
MSGLVSETSGLIGEFYGFSNFTIFTIVTFDRIRRLELFMILINFIVNIKIRLFSYLYGMYCFVRPAKMSFAKVLFASLVLVCSGCSPKYINQTNVDNMMEKFMDGTIELGWVTHGYERYRMKMRASYAAQDWESLAKAVIEGNQHMDIDYYYLGRSAEGLGFYMAAKRYYTKAFYTIYKCYKFPFGCDGFSFPRDIIARIRKADQEAKPKPETSANSVRVKLNKGTASPVTISPGQRVSIVSDYSLALPSSQSSVSVDVTYALKKDDKVLFRTPAQTSQRSAGGFAIRTEVSISSVAKPGTYVVETKVQAGSSYDVIQTVFVVR